MDLIADRGRRVTIEELNTTRLLAHARKQAHVRSFDDVLIVDVDAHHYENENYDEFLPYMENDVLRQLTVAGRKRNRSNVAPTQIGYQDMGGRVTRYPMRSTEKTEEGALRDVQLGHRWMDAMSVDYSCLFPTGMLNIGMHPQKEMEVELCWAYNRWLTEKALPEGGGRFYSMLCLPFSDPEAALRHVETFGDRKHVGGFMVTTVRSHMAVYDNAYMKLYRAMEERGLVLSFHSGPNWGEPLPLRARARLHLVQHPAMHQLGDQRHGRALPQTAGDMDRIRCGLGAVPDAAARSRIHAAPVRGATPEEETVRLHARHVLLVAADGDSGLRGDGVHIPHDQCGDAAPLFV
jgi:predicted TIM-barrel fold metal-dependent hydrolase